MTAVLLAIFDPSKKKVVKTQYLVLNQNNQI